MKNLITILCLCFSFIFSHNTDISYLTKDTTDYFKNGNVKKIKIYDNKDLIKVITFHINKKLESEVNYKDEQKDGESTLFHDNGNLYIKRYYKNNFRHGRGVGYWYNGNIQFERYYRDGLRYGPSTKFINDKNGYIDDQYIYNESRCEERDNCIFTYYDNGHVKSIKLYQSDNNLNIIYYKQSDRIGFNGIMNKEEIYIDGKLVETIDY